MPFARPIALVAAALLLAAGWAHAWSTIVSIAYGDFGSAVTDMTVLADGDVIASGNGDEEVDGVVARFDLATGAYQPLSFGDYCPHPRGIAQVSGGDVVVSGSANGNCDSSTEWVVTRYDAEGRKRWIFTVGGSGGTIAYGADDVLVVGGESIGFELSESFSLARLDPATGSAIWKAAPVGTARRLALDSAGDVYTEVDGGLDGRMGVVKRAVGDGSFLWMHDPAEPSFQARVSRILVDAADDVIVGGQRWQYAPSEEPIPPRNRVVKLKGDTGEVLWTHQYDASWSPGHPELALAANGDVVAAGMVGAEDGDPRWRVERLGAADGVPVWQNDATPGAAAAVALTPDGDVVVTGTVAGSPGISTLRLAGSDGSRLWLSTVDPICTHADSGSAGSAIGVAPDGTVIVGGAVCTDADDDRGVMAVVALRGEDGTLLVPPPTTSTTVPPTTSTVPTTTTTAATTTTSTTVPDDLCATLARSGCLGAGTPRRLRQRLARLCAAAPGTRLQRRLERRIARRLRAERLPIVCVESLSRHL